jgi:hypothetical protein
MQLPTWTEEYQEHFELVVLTQIRTRNLPSNSQKNYSVMEIAWSVLRSGSLCMYVIVIISFRNFLAYAFV